MIGEARHPRLFALVQIPRGATRRGILAGTPGKVKLTIDAERAKHLSSPKTSHVQGELSSAPSTGRLSDRVFQWMVDGIVDGGLRPGQFVSENQIAETLGMSRSPVHQALQVLATEGFVTVVPRRGTFIADFDAGDAGDLYGARALVDGEMVKLCAESLSEGDFDRLFMIVSEMQASIGEHSAYYNCTLQFWRFLQERCPNRILSEMSWLLWRRSIRFRGILLRLPGMELLVQEKLQNIVELISERDAERAGDGMRELMHDVGAVLMQQAFVAHGDGKSRART